MKKVVFITGASSGIGKATAELFLANNYIVINGSRRESKLDGIINYTVDVSSIKSIDKAVDDISEKYGGINILINCAGFSMAAPIEEVLDQDYAYLFYVNLFGAIHLIKRVIPYMKSQGRGKIINISSIGAITPIPYDPYYSASKSALNMLSLTLYTELKKDNINITSIMPGGTKTPFTFARKVYPQTDTNLILATQSLAKIEQNGMSAQSVAKRIFAVANQKNPPIFLTTGLMNKFIYLFSKVLPKKILANITRLVFKLKA